MPPPRPSPRSGTPRRHPLRALFTPILGLLYQPARRGPRPLGAMGEDLAARHLRRHRYRILARNLRIGPGEADLVALAPDRRTIVIVEVKTRLTGPGHPPPEGSITQRKRTTLLGVARAVARKGGWTDRPLRIDVIAIDWPAEPDRPTVPARRAQPTLRHHENAVTP